MYYAQISTGGDYRRGRDVSASLGIVPRQHRSGGKSTLLGISKRGNRPLRSLLIHGARAVVSQVKGKDDPLSQWLQTLIERGGYPQSHSRLCQQDGENGLGRIILSGSLPTWSGSFNPRLIG